MYNYAAGASGILVFALVAYVLATPVPVQKDVTILEPVPLKYSIANSLRFEDRPNFIFWKKTYAQVTLMNEDSVTGKFTVNFMFTKDGKTVSTASSEKEIKAGGIELFEADGEEGATVTATLVVPNKQVPKTVTITENVPLGQFR